MIHRDNKLIFIFCLILLLFIVLPFSYAFNSTDEMDLSISVDNNHLTSHDENSVLADYYFNASVDDEGDGSKSSPYKYLTTDKLVDGSVIYLSNGEYDLDEGKSINKISIIGQSPEKTVIKFKNSSYFLTVQATLTLKNVTLQDVTIKNYASVNATNTIFKNAIAESTYSNATDLVNSALNSFGGAIYCPQYTYSTARIYLDNCTFYNNSAEYGGAIYMYGGNLNIKNSAFLNNFAYNYGGAIACEYNTKITISNSRFENDKSLNDAGGAIYLKTSKLSGNNINITNSSATFGSAITSLYSNVTLNSFKACSNNAEYEGGAVYQFYGCIKVKNSDFINNSARNGGSLFVDDTTSSIIQNCKFTNNSALIFAGAVYSIFNKKMAIKSCEYAENSALVNDDLYESDTLNLTIGNGNYSLYMYKPTLHDELPIYYNSLKEGHVTSIKDQQSGGNCWAFAAIATLESCILKASGDNLDLSEENMKNLMELYSNYGYSMETNQGGHDNMAIGYLISWMGPVLEKNDEYDDYSTLSPILDSVVHIQNIKYVGRNNYTDNDKIKKAILDYGAVATSFYYESTCFNKKTNAYYCSFTTFSNHAVTIVGWDDDYPRKNFNTRPKADGAWIVKNSWNDDWGNDGYFYVSYYDTSFIPLGDNEACYTFIFNETIKYDRNYQYEVIGKTDFFVTGNDNVWCKNIYQSQSDEYLAAVSTFFEKECSWDLYVYVNNALKLTKNGTSELGYYTIDLGQFISLKAGDIFEVVFKISANNASFPISEESSANKISYKEGVSFFSYDGENWTDLFDYVSIQFYHTYLSQVACIKAFTFFNEIASNITLNVSENPYNPIEITANVINQYGYKVMSGNVVFNISGKSYDVKVEDGIASLTANLTEFSTSEIFVTFYANGYLNSTAHASVNITKLSAKLNLKVENNLTSAVISVSVSGDINETLIISVNGEESYVDAINGKAVLVLNDLEYCQYNVKVSMLNETYYSNVPEESFKINVKKTKINAQDLITYLNKGISYSIYLTDVNNNYLSNQEILFIIGNYTFKNKTNDEGMAELNIDLVSSDYLIDVRYLGDDVYLESSSKKCIHVKSSIIKPKASNYVAPAKYSVLLLDREGFALNNTQTIVEVAGTNYNTFTNSDGVLSVDINMKPGNYLVKVHNPATGEILHDYIKVVKRISGNKDLTMYFGSGDCYKVRVLGDDAKAVGAGKIVIFKVNGKTYKVRTDKKGYASLKINLKAKKYTIAVEYKGFKVSNKIIVKPVLTAKNISKKKAKTIKFKVKLVNGKGKPLKGKKITFKFKGKLYKIKTNSKGIATLNLKNLKVGKHVIKSSYGKSAIKNIIKIKK